jgi:hypothetical protein
VQLLFPCALPGDLVHYRLAMMEQSLHLKKSLMAMVPGLMAGFL